MTRPLKALELFAGIGGFAAAAGERATIVGAIDISKHVLEVYEMNNDHGIHQLNLATLDASDLEPFEADLWWMSPPCQPYTVRGHQKDLEDHRAASLVNLLEIISELTPENLAMENVQGFYDSQARQKLLETLDKNGYEVRERLLCTTELGVPAKRERYYMTASRTGLEPVGEPLRTERDKISDYLIEDPDDALFISQAVLDKHGPGTSRMTRRSPTASPRPMARRIATQALTFATRMGASGMPIRTSCWRCSTSRSRFISRTA